MSQIAIENNGHVDTSFRKSIQNGTLLGKAHFFIIYAQRSPKNKSSRLRKPPRRRQLANGASY